MANCSSSDLRSLSPASPSTWSNAMGRPLRDGSPFCATMHRISPQQTCSLSQPLASTCSMFSSSSGWNAETLSGSTSLQTRPRNGLHVRSRRLSLGMRPLARREADRIDPSRVRRSYRRPGRGTLASGPPILRALLQWIADASCFEQGRSPSSNNREPRYHHLTTSPRRASPPILQNLVFGTHTSLTRRLRSLPSNHLECHLSHPPRALPADRCRAR